jgi:hypothetical protein
MKALGDLAGQTADGRLGNQAFPPVEAYRRRLSLPWLCHG